MAEELSDEKLKTLQDNISVLFTFLIVIGVLITLVVLGRLVLGIMTCFELFFHRSKEKAGQKVEAAKKKRPLKSARLSSRSSQSSVSKSTSKRGKQKREDRKLSKSNKVASPKPKPAESSSSNKKEKPASSSGRKWVVEKRGNKSSNSSSIKATSFDVLALPKAGSNQKDKPSSGKSKFGHVKFDNVPEPATNTAHKFESVATKWVLPPPSSTPAKLYKADECPTPNPFKEPPKKTATKSPDAKTPPYAVGQVGDGQTPPPADTLGDVKTPPYAGNMGDAKTPPYAGTPGDATTPPYATSNVAVVAPKDKVDSVVGKPPTADEKKPTNQPYWSFD